MILDAQTRFSNAQAVTAAAASTDIIDLGAARDIGVGEDIYLVVQVTTTFADTGSDSTLAVIIQNDDNASFSSPLTGQTIGTFAALSAAGTRLVAKLQPLALNERYIRVYYTPGGGDLSAGAVSAFLVNGVDAYRPFADNITIS